MKPIVILFATELEAQSFLDESQSTPIADGIYENKISSVVIMGVGKVNASTASAKAICDGAKFIVNAGIAGSLLRSFSLFDVLTPNVFLDLDRISGVFPNPQIEFESKNNLRIGTTDTPIHGGQAKEFAEKHCELVDMESYAIATMTKKFSIDTKFIKCVSDFCEEGGEKNIKANIAKASMILSKTLFDGGYA